jgi:hypothetical protein
MLDIENFPNLVLEPKYIPQSDSVDDSVDENTLNQSTFYSQCRAIHTKLWRILDDKNPLAYSVGYTTRHDTTRHYTTLHYTHSLILFTQTQTKTQIHSHFILSLSHLCMWIIDLRELTLTQNKMKRTLQKKITHLNFMLLC